MARCSLGCYHYCWRVDMILADYNDPQGEHKPCVVLDGMEGGLIELARAICIAVLTAIDKMEEVKQ